MLYTSRVVTASTDLIGTVAMEIEASYAPGFSGLQLIGNTSEVCKDGRERARSALESAGIRLPSKRVLLSLLPGELKKDGAHYDLPLAISIAQLVHGQSFEVDTCNYVIVGELSLSGRLKPVRGAIAIALHALSLGKSGVVVPLENLAELKSLLRLSVLQDSRFEVFGFATIVDTLDWLKGEKFSGQTLKEFKDQEVEIHGEVDKNFDDMTLTPELERLALVIATGGHSCLLRGSPGVGKSMFSERISSILPMMNPEIHLESLKIHSLLSGKKLNQGLLRGRPPVRSPHHSASSAALLGSSESPGELALAHGGVLFLDELPEFRRDLIEALREPLETGVVRISRAKHKIEWRTRILLIAACNNCPCGWFGSEVRMCSCAITRIQSYQRKLSGPILDRIDIHFNMPSAERDHSTLFSTFRSDSNQSKTDLLRHKVQEARRFGTHRRRGVEQVNSSIPTVELMQQCGHTEKVFVDLLSKNYSSEISSRSVMRSLRVARTLADIDASVKVEEEHIQEASGWLALNAARERGEDFLRQ
jgi:magnesium chelatase family protein